MTALQVFKSSDGCDIRTVQYANDTCVVLRDVLSSMESVTRPSLDRDSVVSVFGKDVSSEYPLKTAGGLQQVICVKE